MTPIEADESDAELSGKLQSIRKGVQSTPTGVSRTMLNFFIDAALLFSAMSMTWVSVMLMVVFPVPTRSEGWKLLKMDFNQWRQIQFGLLMFTALLALEHLVLHWKWVCGVIATKILKLKNRPEVAIQAVYGVAAFIGTLIMMGALIVVAMLIVQKPPMD